MAHLPLIRLRPSKIRRAAHNLIHTLIVLLVITALCGPFLGQVIEWAASRF
jgi:hypothetical protein